MDATKTGALIAQARKDRGLTQRELAEKVYVSVQAVSKWELGKNFPDLSLMEPLAEALDLTVTELLSGQRGEEPQDELVRDTLRIGVDQFKPQIKRWKGLFLLAALALAGVLAWLGYTWVRDNTEWLPQRETVFIPIELEEEQNAIVDLLTAPEGRDFLRMYRVVLADDMERVAFRAELWSDGDELLDSWSLGSLYAREHDGSGSRRQLVTFRLTFLENGDLRHKLRLGGTASSSCKPLGLSRPIVGTGWRAIDEPVTVDRKEGAVLLELELALEPEEEGQKVIPYNYRFLVKAYWE